MKDFIDSLTPAEKRYIFERRTPGKQYKAEQRLFNALTRKKIPNDSQSNNSLIKTRLLQRIMKQLRTYWRDSSPRIKVLNYLIDIEIYYEHSAYHLCKKTIRKAKKEAYKYELWQLLMEVLRWETSLFREEGKYLDPSRDSLSNTYKEEQTVLDHINGSINFKYHLLDFLILSRNKIGPELHQELKQYEQILSAPPYTETNLPVTDEIAKQNLLGMFHFAKGDFKSSLKHFTAVYNLINGFDPDRNLLDREYFITLNNLVAIHSTLGNYQQTKTFLAELEKLYADEPAYTDSWFNTTELYKIAIYLELGEFEQGYALLPELEKRLTDPNTRINPINFNFYCFNIAYYYFIFERYTESLNWINKLINEYSNKRKMVRSQIFYYALFFRLLILYELGRMETLQYLLKDTQRSLAGMRKTSQSDETVLQFFGSTIKSENHDKALKALQETLDAQGETAFTLLQFIDLISWAEAKLTHKSLQEVLHNKLRQ